MGPRATEIAQLKPVIQAIPAVLILEDAQELRRTYEQLLQGDGYRVLIVSNFDQAITVLEQDTVAVIVTSVLLGGQTGIDLLRWIHDSGRRSKVIIITGDPSLATASEAVRLGAFDYLIKPVDEVTLKRVVRLALEQTQIERERDEYRDDLAAIFESVAAGVISVDTELRVMRANSIARQLLQLPREYQGYRLAEDGTPAAHSITEALRQAARHNENVRGVRVRLAVPDHGMRDLSINTTPIPGEQDAPRGAVAVLRDVSRETYLESQLNERDRYFRLLGRNPKMQQIYRVVEDTTHVDSTVLVCGESGTGKELVAEAIHATSPRVSKPLIKVNCAALADELLESELFGHVKGAFTSAIRDRIGRFAAANNGTLFLDEIGDISPRLQMRLLRVLQDGEFERVGDSRTVKVNVRIIAATNQDLSLKIRQGHFRQDLYYRLNVLRIQLPPLRDRKDDIPLLVNHFISRFNERMSRNIEGVALEAMEMLLNYSWPGNVRELENVIERAFILCHEPKIQAHHLPQEIFEEEEDTHCPASGQQNERERVVRVLQETDWNIAKSARRLGMARNTLYSRIDVLKIERPL